MVGRALGRIQSCAFEAEDAEVATSIALLPRPRS